ncbi:MAG: hypothetical protein Q8J84_05425 [Flavobacteriaceae bacterium]|nr:hypothetical protein [Flavobacteriaceae bacterium]
MKKIFFLPILLMFITSCEYLSFKKPTQVAIPKMDSIDYSKIDDFPVFPECDSIPSQDKQRICFQMEMSKYIYLTLSQLKINTKSAFNDTIIVKIVVDNLGKTKLSSIQKTANVTQNLPKLDSIISSGLQNLPTLQPAIKRGIPVSAEFSLPIIIKTD